MFTPIRLRHKAQLEGRASDIFGFGNKKARRTTFNHVHGPSPRHDIHASAAPFRPLAANGNSLHVFPTDICVPRPQQILARWGPFFDADREPF